ncbi:alpha/beta fold hydrolase [Amycolatopsis thermoflava]|uniref:alpha/beta fold hydrolase n=1 Tax=Amycolatopsis thermoflava TaxID=84480 RepID=UPI0012FB3721|nr:alpha/beta fold hydrolase [Amycolatopsis thermoflava]
MTTQLGVSSWSLTRTDHDVNGLFVRETRPEAQIGITVPVLLLHGGMHGWWTWERWQSYLGRVGWQTFAMSLPGHTDSAPLPEERLLKLRIADYADAVEEVLDFIGTPAVLVAHSMGGCVAQQVAQRRKLAALVLVTSVGPGRAAPIRPDLPTNTPFVLDREQARKLFFHQVDDDTFEHVFRRLVPESPAALNDYARGGVVSNPDIGCPVLIFEAEHDRPVITQHCRDAADFYHATLIRALDSGHDLMLEAHAEQNAAALHAWLVAHVANCLPAIRTIS